MHTTQIGIDLAKTVFEARATGRFPATIHGKGGKHVTLFYLEVHPD